MNKVICLSLDGGGVKGISVIMTLNKIIEKVNKLRKQNSKSKIYLHDIFNVMGGTSTGGLISLFIGKKKYEVTKALTIYLAGNPADIFNQIIY